MKTDEVISWFVLAVFCFALLLSFGCSEDAVSAEQESIETILGRHSNQIQELEDELYELERKVNSLESELDNCLHINDLAYSPITVEKGVVYLKFNHPNPIPDTLYWRTKNGNIYKVNQSWYLLPTAFSLYKVPTDSLHLIQYRVIQEW